MRFSDTPLFIRMLAQSPLSKRELVVLGETAPTRYKEHYIRKRNGRGLRLISQPTSEVKYFQKLLVENELNDLIVHPAATAYRSGKSIFHHAQPHANSKYLLKLDFENFFPSLSAQALKNLLLKIGRYTDEEIYFACQLLCKKAKNGNLSLSIGAPSSPFMSNALMNEFDSELADYCIEQKIVYTRYADDIALSTSTPRKLDEAHLFVSSLLTKYNSLNLRLNQSKTVNVSRKSRRILTGITLSNNGSASIGRKQKRLLRAAVHQLSTSGISETSKSRIRGLLAFTYSLDPEWVMRLCKRYGYSSINDIGND